MTQPQGPLALIFKQLTRWERESTEEELQQDMKQVRSWYTHWYTPHDVKTDAMKEEILQSLLNFMTYVRQKKSLEESQEQMPLLDQTKFALSRICDDLNLIEQKATVEDLVYMLRGIFVNPEAYINDSKPREQDAIRFEVLQFLQRMQRKKETQV